MTISHVQSDQHIFASCQIFSAAKKYLSPSLCLFTSYPFLHEIKEPESKFQQKESQDMDISPIVTESDGDENATSQSEAIPTTCSQSQCPHMKAGLNYLTLKSLDLNTSPGVAEPGGYKNVPTSTHAPNLPAAEKNIFPLSSDPATTDESVTILTNTHGLIDNSFIDPVLTMNPSESSSVLPFFIPISEIVQTKKLELEILDCASASWHFNRDIGPIITKMERLSLSTGAWV
ncbi:hypothetical protein BDQ17DRAFT_1334124 [Cyathus striatus]|nr:hypothetical protein BDQ17DRAFT_1334124 [Cyathus striatus]